MIRITVGLDGAKWVAIDRDSGTHLTFGSRKPSREAVTTAVRRQLGKRPAINEPVEIEWLGATSEQPTTTDRLKCQGERCKHFKLCQAHKPTEDLECFERGSNADR